MFALVTEEEGTGSAVLCEYESDALRRMYSNAEALRICAGTDALLEQSADGHCVRVLLKHKSAAEYARISVFRVAGTL